MKVNPITFGSLKCLLLFLAITAAAASVVSAQASGKFTDQKGRAEQAVRQTLDELYKALGANDAAALDRIYADDYTLVNEEGVVTSKAPRLAAIRSGAMKYENISFTDASVRIHGDTAVAIYRVMLKATSNGKEVNGPVRVTATFVNAKGRWVLLAAQATRIGE